MPFPPGIRVDQDGEEWILRRTAQDGKTRGIRLSTVEILSLIEQAPIVQRRVLATLPGPESGLQPVFSLPLQRIDVGGDVLGADVLLAVVLMKRLTLPFSLSPSHPS